MHSPWSMQCRGWSLALMILWISPALAQAVNNSCLDCHSALEAPLQVTAEQFAQDIHAQKGLKCSACHGGDPNDAERAMSPSAGFRGKVKREQIPALCGSCHSDPSYMRGFNPSLRTDQLLQYRTSKHGKLLTQGDTRVAVCTDCHSVHNIRPASDPRSTVHPLSVAATCSRCHSDRERMKSYRIATDQFAGYSGSVHHEALVVRGDLSAPTCTTCHGNHGAAPPGVASVEHVCSTCHTFQAQLFDTSPHKQPFAAGGLPVCVTCHSNHRIEHPTDEMIGAGPKSVCTNCHSPDDHGLQAATLISGRMTALRAAITRSDAALGTAARTGVELGEAQLELAQARDALTKARVTVHTFNPQRVEEDIAAGLKVTDKTYAAAMSAMSESRKRRAGLAVSLVTILLTLLALALYVRSLERKP